MSLEQKQHERLLHRTVFWSLMLVALLVRVVIIDRREFWLDESVSGLFAGADSLGELLGMLRQESNPPLYYLFLFTWEKLYGNSELSLRLPSLLFGLMSVWLMWRVTAQMGGRLLARGLAAAVGALSPLWVFYSLEARSYMMFWTLGLAVASLLKDWVDERETTDAAGRAGAPLIGASALTLAAFYTNYFGALLMVLWVWAFFAGPSGNRTRCLVAAVAPIALFLPWFFLAMPGHAESGGTRWIEGFWHGPLDSLLNTFLVFSLAGPFPRYLGELGQLHQPIWQVFALGTLFGAPAVAGWFAVNRKDRFLLLGTLVAAVGVPILVSLVRPVALAGRYEVLGYPAYVVLWAQGGEWLVGRLPSNARQVAGWALAALVLAGLSIPAFDYLSLPQPMRPYESAVERIVAASDTRSVVAVGYAYGVVAQKLDCQDRIRVLAYPSDVTNHPGWLNLPDYNEEVLNQQAEQLVGSLPRGGVVWLVSQARRDGRPVFPMLDMPLYMSLKRAGFVPGKSVLFGEVVALPLQFSLENQTHP